MRVVHVIQAFHPLIGGAERQLLAVAPHLQALGVDVHVVTRRHPHLAAQELVRGIPVHRLGSPGSGLGSVAFTARGQVLLRRLAPDVVHAYELLSPTTTALVRKRFSGVPVVTKVLGSGELDLVRTRPLGQRRLRSCLAGVDRFHVISDDIDGLLAAAGVPREARVQIPNGVDVDAFRPASQTERSAARDDLQLPASAAVVLYVGRLATEKGLADLLEAWSEVHRAQPDAQLLVAGTGPQRELLRRCASPGVRELGAVDDVTALLRASDVLVLPSHAEGASNAVLEAFAAGVPVVATAVGGTPELAGGGERARLVPPREPQVLAAALLEVLTETADAALRAQAARDWVVGHRRLQVVAASLLELYDSLAPRRGGLGSPSAADGLAAPAACISPPMPRSTAT